MAAILMALAIAATPAPHEDRCGLRRLSLCRDTNQLVWDKQFQQSVAHFVGPRRATYLGRRAPVAAQMIEVLGGPPDPPTRIGERFRFTACRAHSCGEKGAAVLEPDGRLVALAILHSACGDPHHANDCYAHDTLTIFIRAPKAPDVIDNLTGWAKSEVARDSTAPGTPATHIDAVDIEQVR